LESNANEFIAILQDKGVEIIEFSSHEKDTYRQEWFKRIVPANKQQKARESYCLARSGFLWHVFSYEILDCIKGNEAKKAFNSLSKQKAVLLVNVGNIASCRLKNISNVTAECLDVLNDVILTGCNFEWVYVKTHESECGPYFYSIRK